MDSGPASRMPRAAGTKKNRRQHGTVAEAIESLIPGGQRLSRGLMLVEA